MPMPDRPIDAPEHRGRILHVDAGREWRGGQRQVLLLADGLRARGYESRAVAAPASPLLERLLARGITTAAIAMRGDLDLRAAHRLRTVIRAWRPDVIHAHDARSHAIALLAGLGRAPTPLVVTRRVDFPIKSGRVKYGPRVARFIAISHAVAGALVRGGVARERIAVVHSGVPTPTVDQARDWRAECGWPADTLLCGVVGAMSVEKGIDTLAAVAERLPPAARARMRLVLLGGASTGRESIGGIDALRAGFVHEVHAAMAGLDVLWHPSSAEGLGTAVIDAMALGVPPVAFAVGGLPELIEHGTSGLLVPPGDVPAFAAAAANLLEDPALRARLAAGGRARARHFDAAQMVDGTAAVYAALLGAMPAAHAGA